MKGFPSPSCFAPVLALLLFGVSCLVFPSSAKAFPPAPTFTINGVVRDSFGWALKASDVGTVVFKRNGLVIAEAPIDERGRASENFRTQLAMDTNPAAPYSELSQSAGVLFTIEVRFPTQTLLVTSINSSQRTVGQPAGSVFLDFTIGVDTDGDGIPDAWEFWQLSELGIGSGDPRWSLTTLGTGDFDGDGLSDRNEYLAGTFAFLADDKLFLNIEGFEADGSARLRTLLVVDKSYRIEVSTDLLTWTTVSTRLGAPAAQGERLHAHDEVVVFHA
jgi:hypothetical protein